MKRERRSYDKEFKTIWQAKNHVFEFIEGWYNKKRKHGFLGHKTPEEFENIYLLECA